MAINLNLELESTRAASLLGPRGERRGWQTDRPTLSNNLHTLRTKTANKKSVLQIPLSENLPEHPCNFMFNLGPFPMSLCFVQTMCASVLDSTLEEVRRYDQGPPGSGAPTIGLVIDGPTLAMALESDLQARFLELTRRCRSVLCCRATPLQKGHVVKVVREKLKVMTLAIGRLKGNVCRVVNHVIVCGLQLLMDSLLVLCDVRRRCQ